MLSGRDFVFTGLQSWDIPMGSNAKNLALEISKHNRVLYVNPPLDKINLIKGSSTAEFIQRKDVIKKKRISLRQISSSLWVLDYPFSILPVNFLPDGFCFDLINRINNKRMYQYTLKVIKEIGLSNFILFTDNDIYRSFYASEYLNPSQSIYYRRDIMQGGFWQKHAPRLEPLLCAKRDLVLTNSEQLATEVRPYNNHSYDIGQGVDLSDYDFRRQNPIPEDLKDIPSPIIGYMGWIIARRLDADLIYEVAQRCPHYSFVMVGGEDETFKTHPLHQLPNIYFLGPKKPAETIAYIAHFDVCMNPQRVNRITAANYPRKVDEYLALGKPVVATATETMKIFDRYVWNCLGTNQYVNAIEEALQSDSIEKRQQRIEFAHTHTWENCVQKIYNAINLINNHASIQDKATD